MYLEQIKKNTKQQQQRQQRQTQRQQRYQTCNRSKVEEIYQKTHQHHQP